tara:strand:+ start:1136 stop:2308 length:1173 start_codon:yes stop_codon:yes gene_type:complete
MKKSLLLSFLSFALFISCEEDASSRDEVVGVWYMPQSLNRVTAGASADRLGGYSLNAWNYSMMVTTNIDQEFVDQMSKGIGAINVSGYINGDMAYMQGWSEPFDSGSSVYVSSYDWFSMFEGPNSDSGAFMGLSLNNYNGDGIGDPADSGFYGYDDDYFSAYLNDGSYFDVTQQIEYSYDGKTLTVPSQELRDYRDSILTIGGTLSHSTIDIPANTSTKIMGYDGNTSWDYGSWAIHIKEDGRWVEVFTFEEPQGQDGWSNVYVDSTVAEWDMKDDQIVVTYRYDDFWPDAGGGPGIGQGTWLYQVSYTYEIVNGNLKLLNEFNMCEDDMGGFCLEMLEYQYRFDPGSLKEMKMVWELEFTKSPNLKRMPMYSEPMRKSLARHPAFKIQK